MQAISFLQTSVLCWLLIRLLHCAFQIYLYKIPRNLEIYSCRSVPFLLFLFINSYVCYKSDGFCVFGTPCDRVDCKTRPFLLPRARVTWRLSQILCNSLSLSLCVRCEIVYVWVDSWDIGSTCTAYCWQLPAVNWQHCYRILTNNRYWQNIDVIATSGAYCINIHKHC